VPLSNFLAPPNILLSSLVLESPKSLFAPENPVSIISSFSVFVVLEASTAVSLISPKIEAEALLVSLIMSPIPPKNVDFFFSSSTFLGTPVVEF
jgi:hypothetical protein